MIEAAEAAAEKQAAVDLAGQDAALLSAVEIGLGSLLHAFKVPLSGQFLSLNQIFMISRSAKNCSDAAEARTIGFQVSFIAALLKSLAPAGKKLTPMLAIAAQGLLFSLGTMLFGANLVGMLVGGALSGVWAYVQPFLIYLLIFGTTLLKVIAYFTDKLGEVVSVTQENWVMILLGFVAIKMLLSWGAVLLAWFLPVTWVGRYQRKLLELRWRQKPTARKPVSGSMAGMALRDLCNPLFVSSLVLTLMFLFFVESSWSQLIWYGVRSLSVAYAIFYLLRWLPARISRRWIETGPLRGFSRSLGYAARAVSSESDLSNTARTR